MKNKAMKDKIVKWFMDVTRYDYDSDVVTKLESMLDDYTTLLSPKSRRIP